MIDDGKGAFGVKNWRLRLLTSGTLTFTDLGSGKNGIQVFLVGGGGGGWTSTDKYHTTAGGGGYTLSSNVTGIKVGTQYSIVVGAGGATQKDGGTNTAFGLSAAGGKRGAKIDDAHYQAGAGGSGGSGYTGAAGSDGKNGANSGGNGATIKGGQGQGTSTREFYSLDKNTSATLYAGGGTGLGGTPGAGGGGGYELAGTINTGGGGGARGAGGSGIVIIRNAR